MHGLVNHSIQLFVCAAYSVETWHAVTRTAELDFTEFESMLKYDEHYTTRIVRAMSEVLGRPQAEIMEDFGAFLVSHPGFEAVRRLLRFGGEDFVDFLHSLDDLADSVRLAVSDLNLPKAELHVISETQFKLFCETSIEGYSYVMMGVLRVMADDYGALAFLEHLGPDEGAECVAITLVESEFSEGRSFDLAANFA